jgi:hypothetical protein
MTARNVFEDSPYKVTVDRHNRTRVEVKEVPNKVVPSAPGPQGPAGTSIKFGSGAPTSAIGENGDIYIDTDTGFFYGPKADGEWPEDPFFSTGTTSRYVFTQASASSTWNITHPLGGRPSVTVVDTGGTVVIGEVTYNSNTQVTVSFTAPFSGYAYLT